MNRYAVTATHVTEHTESGDITRERTVTKKAPLGTPRTRGVRRRQTPRRRPIWKMMSGYRTPERNEDKDRSLHGKDRIRARRG